MTRVLGIYFARSCGWAEIDARGVRSGAAEVGELSPQSAVNAFMGLWRLVRGDECDIVAVGWPGRIPTRYAGLFAWLETRPNVRSVPPAALKSVCGGPACTVADVVATTRRLYPDSGADSLERAFAVIAAGLAAHGPAGVGDRQPEAVDAV